MKKKFISNLIFLLTLNIPIKALWILYVDRKVYNHPDVGQAVYGEYASVLGFSFLFHILLDLGISNYNNRSIAQDPQKLHVHYPNILLIKGLLTIAYLSVVFTMAWLLNFSESSMTLLKILAFNQILNVFIYFNKSNLSGLHLFRIDSIFSVLDRVVAGILCILVFHNVLPIQFDIKWYIIFQFFGYLVSAILSTGIILSKVHWKDFRLDFTLVKKIVKDALPFTLLGLLMVMYSKIDIVMVKKMLAEEGNYQAGIYAGAYKLLDAGAMICFLFASLLFPIFSKMLKDKESVKPIINFTVKSFILPSLIFSIIASFMSVFIMNTMYKHAEAQMYTCFSILIFTFVPLASQYTFGTLLTAGNYLRLLNISSAIGLGLNIILNLILIPKMGAIGAAIATLLTQILANSIQFIYAYKRFEFNISTKQTLAFITLVIGVMGLGYSADYIALNNFLKLPLLIGASSGLAYLLNLFDIQSVLSIVDLKRKQ